MSISKYNWFEKIIGFNEADFNYTLEELPSSVISRTGKFSQLSIKELIILKEKLNKIKNNKHLKLFVNYRNDNNNVDKFDTSALQYYSENNTLFQVASNFNCLEVPSASYNPFNGYFITKQMTDRTQGPSASGGASFGSILRLIKHKEKNIDLLENTNLITNNGKLKYSDNSDFKEFDSDLIKVGFHQNVMACFLRSDEFRYKENGAIINQVFTSTCICSDNKPNNLSKLLLEKAYEGTYLCGIIHDVPKIVLTLIGGGVFNNYIPLIIEIIARVHEKYSPYLVKNCEVVLPIYEPKPYSILSEFKKYKDVDIKLIK